MREVEVGAKFGGWEVTALSATGKILCKCVCGRTERTIRRYDLLTSKTLMCRKCSVALTKTSHGSAPNGGTSPEYNTWMHMIQRCHNPGNKDYKNYGGRGIQVCSLWRESFEAFLLMVGKKPFPEATIDRTDVNKGYEPGNCTWASRTEQNRNTRSNVRIVLDGVSKVVTEWVQDPACTVTPFTVYKRLKRGWEPREAIFTPSGGKRST